eukprot:6189203-Pleurochrysis_carterae.AAC.4
MTNDRTGMQTAYPALVRAPQLPKVEALPQKHDKPALHELCFQKVRAPRPAHSTTICSKNVSSANVQEITTVAAATRWLKFIATGRLKCLRPGTRYSLQTWVTLSPARLAADGGGVLVGGRHGRIAQRQ